MQKKLDEKILERFPHLRNEDLLPKKILALQVELGELCNCWRGFKFWSNNREPRLKGYKEIKCKWCNGSGDDGSGVCPDCKCEGYVYKEYNPLLEEFVDCLHFILSIGLELYDEEDIEMIAADLQLFRRVNIIEQFQGIFYNISRLRSGGYTYLFEYFLGLGEMLGFTWGQIEESYFEKNRINHERQNSGY